MYAKTNTGIGSRSRGVAIAIVIAVVVVLVTFYKVFIRALRGIGLLPSNLEKNVIKSQDKIIVGSDQYKKWLYKNHPSTQSDSYWLSLADTIDNCLNHEWWDDESAAKRYLMYCQNDTDVYKLIDAYGERPTITTFTLKWNYMTLAENVQDELSSSQIKEVNEYYKSKGITYRF